MTNQERQQKIESYQRAYAILVEGLKQFPPDMWHYRPTPDQWTIHEIIIHITDSEANSYIRCRRFIAEPGQTLMGYDEKSWAMGLDYHRQSTTEALELFKWLRHNTHQLILTLPESVWTQHAYHSESGLMTLDNWLDIYERHIPDHLAQMQEIYAAWLKQQ